MCVRVSSWDSSLSGGPSCPGADPHWMQMFVLMMCVCLTPVATSFRVKWSVCDSVPVRVSKWYDDTSCSFPTRLNWISCWNIICLRLQAWALVVLSALQTKYSLFYQFVVGFFLRISHFVQIKSRLLHFIPKMFARLLWLVALWLLRCWGSF